MKIVFSSQAWEDYLHWQHTDKKLLKRINDLIKEIVRTPLKGPENQNRSGMRWVDTGPDELMMSTAWSTK